MNRKRWKIHLRSYEFQMYVCELMESNMYNHGKNSMIKSNYNLLFWASLVVDPEEVNHNLLQLRRLKIGENFSAKALHSPAY